MAGLGKVTVVSSVTVAVAAARGAVAMEKVAVAVRAGGETAAVARRAV